MTIVHIGKTLSPNPNHLLTTTVAFKSEAPTSTQQALITSFEALAHQCINPKKGVPYIKSLKAGRQNSLEDWTKGLEFVFVLEFEVSLFPIFLSFLISPLFL